MTTFISYLGGSAGDMFTASCNGILLHNNGFYQNSVISVSYKPYALKPQEKKIVSGSLTIDSALTEMPFDYISTHLFEELAGRSVISIVVEDSEVYDRIINRQLYLQKLDIDDNVGSVTENVVKLCSAGKYTNAAKFWFLFSKKLAQEKMAVRLQSTKFPTLDFSKLFTEEFVPSVLAQGWNVNIDTLTNNHNYWLMGQPTISADDAISSIAKKMQERYG